jgi:hypothetical protein
MGAARPGLVRNALGSAALLGIVAAIAFGLPAIDRRLPAIRPVAGGTAYVVGGGVTVIPPRTATLDVSQTRPTRLRGTALFRLGLVRYAIVATPYRGSLVEAAARLRAKIMARTGYQVTGPDRIIRTEGGIDGVTGVYSSPGRLGRYSVFVAGGTAVEATASGPESDLLAALPALDASVRTIAIGPRR